MIGHLNNPLNNPLQSSLKLQNQVHKNYSAVGRLVGGLRINGQAQDLITEIKPNLQESVNLEQPDIHAPKITARFAETLLRRLRNEGDGQPESLEKSQNLVNQILTSLDEIKKQFGQPAANQVIAEILTNTEHQVSDNQIAAAFSNVLRSIDAANKAVMSRGDITKEEYDQALEIDKKLLGMPDFLNEAETATKADGQELGGLATALNGYFAQPGWQEEDLKRFDIDFAWLSAAAIEEKNNPSNKGEYFTLTVDELGRENLNELFDFLRHDLGSDDAAKIIENLSGDDDIFEAVEKVRDLFYADTYKVNTRDATSLILREGPGLEKIEVLGAFLNVKLVDKVNETIINNPEVKKRMFSFAAKDFGSTIPENCGLYSWPGGWGVLADGDLSWRDAQGRPDIHFSQLIVRTAEEDDILLWQANEAYHSLQAGLTRDPQGKADYLARADQCRVIHEDLATAYKSNAVSRYKGFREGRLEKNEMMVTNEMVLDNYQSARQFASGNLVDVEI